MKRENNPFFPTESDQGLVSNSLVGETLFTAGLLDVVWRNRWLILATVLLSLGLAVVYLQRATPIYRSESRLYVEPTGPKIINELEEGVMTRFGNYLYTQAELLRSTPILTAAVEKGRLSRMRTFADVDNPVAFLDKTLESTVGRKDDLITIAMMSPFPTEAAEIVNGIVDAYVTYHTDRKRSTSTEVLRILQQEKVERTQELSGKLQALMEFRRENPAVSFDTGQGNFLLRQIERLSSAHTEASMAAVESQLFHESVQAVADDFLALSQLIESQGANGTHVEFVRERARLQSRLSDLRTRRADRMRQLTADHPGVAAIDAELRGIEEQLGAADARFAEAQLTIAAQASLAAQRKQQQIAGQLEEQQQRFAALNEKITEYLQLQSEHDRTKKLCDMLDERIKELNVTEDVGALNISILEVARPADRSSEPQRARVLTLALGLGLLAGCGFALAREMLDQRLRSVEEASALLGAPVLGVIPVMSRRQDRHVRGQATYLRSQSHAAEAYRTIRTAVFFGIPKSEAKTILVTSAAPGEGKSTVVSNLAIAMAQAGQKVLVIDADFRRPVQNAIFQLNHEELGLSSVLAESLDIEQAIQKTRVENLHLLACGPHVSNPSEVLNSRAFAELLASLAEMYDRILIDSPPVGPVTDAQVLAGLAHVTILVLNMERSKRRAVCHAYESLRAVNGRVLGIVANEVRQGRQGYYGRYEGYGSYYRLEEESTPQNGRRLRPKSNPPSRLNIAGRS